MLPFVLEVEKLFYISGITRLSSDFFQNLPILLGTIRPKTISLPTTSSILIKPLFIIWSSEG